MSSTSRFRRFLAAALAVAATGLLSIRHAGAEIADIAKVPLANSPSDAVLPNLMYVLDDSGSMAWNYMPDQRLPHERRRHLPQLQAVLEHLLLRPRRHGNQTGCQCGNDESDPDTLVQHRADRPTARRPSTPTRSTRSGTTRTSPTRRPSTSSGTSLGNATPTLAADDAYLGTAKTNLVAGFNEVIYCNTSSPTGADLTNPLKCRKNGLHNVTPFTRGRRTTSCTGAPRANNVGFPRTDYFNKVLIKTSNAHYFNITPHEYCSDSNLVNCVLANAPARRRARPRLP